MLKSPMDMTFPERLYQLRIDKGKNENKDITQEIASGDMGIHVNSLRKYENNSIINIPKIDQLTKIRDYYKVSYEYLLGETNSQNPNPDYCTIQNEIGLSDKSMKVMSTFSAYQQYALNYLIESEKDYKFINKLYEWLWFNERYQEVIKRGEKITDDNIGFSYSINMLENSKKFDVDKTLIDFKNEVDKKLRNDDKK